jgi:hypothetical protein
MAGIARNVELYILAYKLAWKYISEDHKRAQPDIALHLHNCIRRQLKEGATEAVFIASHALENVERTKRDAPLSQGEDVNTRQLAAPFPIFSNTTTSCR